MNKRDLINSMAENAGITKTEAKKALEGLLIDIEGSLQKGKRVSLLGFGSWSVSRRAARDGRNPQTGKIIRIKAKNVIKFKAGNRLILPDGLDMLTGGGQTDDTGPMKLN